MHGTPEILWRRSSGVNAAQDVTASFISKGTVPIPGPAIGRIPDAFILMISFTAVNNNPLVTITDTETGKLLASFNAPRTLVVGFGYGRPIAIDDSIPQGLEIPYNGFPGLPGETRAITVHVPASGAGCISIVTFSGVIFD